jgi:hypothetical protein
MSAPKIVVLAALAACTSCSSHTASPSGASVPADGACLTAGGTTTLAPTYAYALAFDESDVYAATPAGIVAFPLGGGSGTTIGPATEVDALAVANGSAYFVSSHPVGGPNAQGKTSSTTALYSMALASGSPQILVDNAFAMTVATDGTWLWWTGIGLNAMQLPGGTPVAFPLAAGANVTALVVGDDSLFLGTQTLRKDYTHYGSIVRASKDGTSVTPIFDDLADGPISLAVDESSVYWVDSNGVQSAALDGSGLTTLATTVASSIAVDAHAVYFTSNLGSTSDTVQKVDKSGGTPVLVAGGLKSPGFLALHGGNVYWVDGTSVAMSDPNPGYAVMTACK